MTWLFQTSVLSSIKWGFVITPAQVEPDGMSVADPNFLLSADFHMEGPSLNKWEVLKQPPGNGVFKNLRICRNMLIRATGLFLLCHHFSREWHPVVIRVACALKIRVRNWMSAMTVN